MGDAVAIVSVATSAAVGVTGIVSTVYGAISERRWRSSEERVAELRDVLDAAACALGASMQNVAEAHASIDVASLGAEAVRATYASDELAAAGKQLHELWVLWNRVRVRVGQDATVARALVDARQAILALDDLVRKELGRLEGDRVRYRGAWDRARAAETAFYRAAAAELSPGRSSRGSGH